MQEFYKGQKLYYRHEHHICECEVVGWNHNNVKVRLANGECYIGPKWRVGFTMFNSKKALIAAEEQHKRHTKEVEESIPTTDNQKDKDIRCKLRKREVVGERPSYKDTPSNKELSQNNTERKHGMPSAGKDMNTRSIMKGSIYSKSTPRMKGPYGSYGYYKKKK